MSENYLVLFYEIRPLEERFEYLEDRLHCALIVEPPNAQDVANDLCAVLNCNVDFKQNAVPHFAVAAAASPPDTLRARFDEEIKDCADQEGRADGDPHSRMVAYHQKARELEVRGRSRKGAKEWPPDEGLHLRAFRVAWRGMVCVLTVTQYRLLETIFKSPGDVDFETLNREVWQGNEPAQHTIQSTLSQAKVRLRSAGLKEVADALYTKAAQAHFDRKKLPAPTILTDF